MTTVTPTTTDAAAGNDPRSAPDTSRSADAGRVADPDPRPTLAVWKFASCDGCQLTLLNCEDELLALAGRVRIAYFPEATRAVVAGPYDISLVEGSITTPDDAQRIQQVREQSRILVTIGACATAGGIQALRNAADVAQYLSIVYAHPEYVRTLQRSTPIAAHVTVEHELRGCPIDRHQLLELIAALLQARRPRIPTGSVCVECKRRGTVCVAVADGIPCLGPATQAGCGALCPAFHRGCYGCFGPQDTANAASLASRMVGLGMPRRDVVRMLRTFNVGAEGFRVVADAMDDGIVDASSTITDRAPDDDAASLDTRPADALPTDAPRRRQPRWPSEEGSP